MLRKSLVCCIVVLVLLASQALAQDLDKKKQTSLGKYVTAEEALKMWEADKAGVTIVDIRPVAAYYYLGHPKMAHSLPFLFWTGKWDPEKKVYTFARNGKFVEQMAAKFKKDQKLLLLSKAGVRAAQAIELLAPAGFTNVYNITDGFDGWQLLPNGQIVRSLNPELIFQK